MVLASSASRANSRMSRRLVLFVVNDAPFFVSHRLPLAIGIRAAGYDVHVATPRGPISAIIDAGFEHHTIALDRSSTSPAAELRAVMSLVGLYRAIRPTLVHHVTAKPILYGGVAARVARVPAVVHAVTGLGYAFIDPRPKARALRFAVRRAYRVATAHENCAVVFQNEDDRAVFADVLRCKFTQLIPGSGVDTCDFKPSPLPETSAPIVVLPARMLADKGVNEFVEAARALRRAGSPARFVLAGGVDSNNPNAIPRDRLDAWVNEGVVEWWGHRTDMPDVLRQATVVCLPSYREGMPKALLEASIIGRPIVTTNVPGCRHAVRPEFSRLVPARDSAALINAFSELLDQPALLREMGSAASVHGARTFDVRSVIAETLKVYERLLV
jgi:glycosyltransferase involved in cell wall biosynthesis